MRQARRLSPSGARRSAKGWVSGVGALGSLSLPLTASDDSMVKVASETIPAGQFYDRFFALIERYLVLDTPEPEPSPPTRNPICHPTKDKP